MSETTETIPAGRRCWSVSWPEYTPTDVTPPGLELRRVWGAQDDAFAASALPLAQGLPDRRVGI